MRTEIQSWPTEERKRGKRGQSNRALGKTWSRAGGQKTDTAGLDTEPKGRQGHGHGYLHSRLSWCWAFTRGPQAPAVVGRGCGAGVSLSQPTPKMDLRSLSPWTFSRRSALCSPILLVSDGLLSSSSLPSFLSVISPAALKL